MYFYSKSLLLFIWCIIFLTVNVTSLQITEIMFNPNGSDSGREWIEIYNDGLLDINLSGLRFYESATNHLAALTNGESVLHPGEYAVIIDKPEKFFSDYPYLEVSNIAIFDSAFSLLNSGEYITVRKDDIEMTSVNYSIILDYVDVDEGFSLSLVNYSWDSSISVLGTPGYANIIFDEPGSNSTSDNNTCDINLNIEIDKSIFENKESFKYKHRLTNLKDDNKFNYTIEYWIEDIFNDTVKAKRNTTNVDKKSWTPSINDKVNAFVLKAFVYPDCNDTNLANNYAEKIIVVRNKQDADSNSSGITKDSCNVSLRIFSDTIINNSETIRYKHYLNTLDYNFTIKYWIEDIFGNNIRSTRNTTNTNKKSFTPKIEEKEKSFVLKAIVYPDCNDTDIEDNYAEKVVVVKNHNYKQVEEGCTAEKDSRTEKRKPQLEYYISNLPPDAAQNSTFTFTAKIINNDDKLHEIKLYSYVYRGNKCISGDGNRTMNLIDFVIEPEAEMSIEMNNTISYAKPGEYKVKLVINKDNQKTNYNLIRNINVTSNETDSRSCNCSASIQTKLLNYVPVYSDDVSAIVVESVPYNAVVYESNNMVIKDRISYFVIVFMAVCMIFMIFWKGVK